MTNLTEKVDYTSPDGYEHTAYVHPPERVRNLENIDGSPATDYRLITCGIEKHSDEPVALQWDGERWVQLVPRLDPAGGPETA